MLKNRLMIGAVVVCPVTLLFAFMPRRGSGWLPRLLYWKICLWLQCNDAYSSRFSRDVRALVGREFVVTMIKLVVRGTRNGTILG